MSPIASVINDRTNDEAETIWNPDIEQSFLEALAIYPPCGRRKIILTGDGKVYGRNELVARYIKIRTGKIRTRKQVSSHLQVLTKRRSKELQLLREDKQAQQIILERLRQSTPTELQLKVNEEGKIYSTESEFSSASNSESEISISSVQNLLTTSTNPSDPVHIENIEISHQNPQMISSQESNKALLVSTIKNHPSPSSFTTSPRSSSYGLDQSRCSSSHSSFSISLPTTPVCPSLPRRSSVIGDDNFHLLDLIAFMEWKQTSQSPMSHWYSEILSMYQHDLIRFNTNDSQMKEMQSFETIFIDQVSDKFDGLKDLFHSHPHGPFFLIKFWADVPLPTVNSIGNADQSFFTSYSFSSCLYRPIHVSTQISSFGKQVLEKVEVVESPQQAPLDQFIYRFDRSPLSYYLVEFIHKLRTLSDASLMNDVLENFTMLQVIKSFDGAQQLLLCLAFVFEVALFNAGGPQYQVYKLVAN